MESFYTLLKIILILYLGCFTYLLYQMLFYHQKRFLFLKTICFFFCMAVLMIQAMNHYHIILFYTYFIFYLLGIYLTRKFLKNNIMKINQELKKNLKPIQKYCCKLFKTISIPPVVYYLKEQNQKRKYYKLHPDKKPKTPYELF